MMYVFQRSNVRMTIPSRLSCSPRWKLSSFSATAAIGIEFSFLSLAAGTGALLSTFTWVSFLMVRITW